MIRVRDNQKQRLYDAEDAAAVAHSGGHWRQTIPNDQLQDWVNDVLRRRQVASRWLGRCIEVRLSHGGGRAHGPARIHLGVWARNEWVVLHEITHCLLYTHDIADHGPEFAGVYLFLVETVIGKDAARCLREAYRKHRVRYTRKALPAPRFTVPTKAAAAAKARAKANSPVTDKERSLAADILRRAAKQGVFGDSGRKPRVHALSTARMLET